MSVSEGMHWYAVQGTDPHLGLKTQAKTVLAAEANCLYALAKHMPGNRAYEQSALANSTVLAGKLQLSAGIGALHVTQGKHIL